MNIFMIKEILASCAIEGNPKAKEWLRIFEKGHKNWTHKEAMEMARMFKILNIKEVEG